MVKCSFLKYLTKPRICQSQMTQYISFHFGLSAALYKVTAGKIIPRAKEVNTTQTARKMHMAEVSATIKKL